MQSVNLMPQDYTRNLLAKRRLLITCTAMLALVIAMFGLAKLIYNRASRTTQLNAVLAAELDRFERTRAELATDIKRLRELDDKLALVQTLNHNRRWASYFALVAHAANDQIILTRAKIISLQPPADGPGTGNATTPQNPTNQPPQNATRDPANPAPAATQTPQTKPGGPAAPAEPALANPEKLTLLLEGLALSNTDVTRFIAALNASRAFDHVTFKGSQTAELNSTELSRFELECPIRYEPAARTTQGGPK